MNRTTTSAIVAGCALLMIPLATDQIARAGTNAPFVSVRPMGEGVTQSGRPDNVTYLGDWLAVGTYDRTPGDGKPMTFRLCRQAGGPRLCETRTIPSDGFYGRFVRVMPSWVRGTTISFTWYVGGRTAATRRLTVQGD